MFYKLLKFFLDKFNLRLISTRADQSIAPEFIESYEKIKNFTMVDKYSSYAAWRAINYVIDRNIDGAVVECGVWRGGVSIMMASVIEVSNSNKKQYLYDTFEGMSQPTSDDIDKYGVSAQSQLSTTTRDNTNDNVWAYASIEDVKQNFALLDISMNNINFIKGKVEETIPKDIPESISLLRLDTDWYESTKHELEYLYPLLSKGGVLLIDDYGYWSGCKKAVDDYFLNIDAKPFFADLPDGGLVAIKI